MAARKVYLDTSVIGGYYDEEFKEETRSLWKLEQRGFFQFVTSTVTLTEIARAPERIRRLFRKTFDDDALLRGSCYRPNSHRIFDRIAVVGFWG